VILEQREERHAFPLQRKGRNSTEKSLSIDERGKTNSRNKIIFHPSKKGGGVVHYYGKGEGGSSTEAYGSLRIVHLYREEKLFLSGGGSLSGGDSCTEEKSVLSRKGYTPSYKKGLLSPKEELSEKTAAGGRGGGISFWCHLPGERG